MGFDRVYRRVVVGVDMKSSIVTTGLTVLALTNVAIVLALLVFL